MLLQPRSIRLPDGYNFLDEPIAGTEKLIARWPGWFAEFGITPDLMLRFTHAEHARCSLPFKELRKMRFGINDKQLDKNQRRRFWDELIKWQALLIKQLAARDQRNVYYRESLKHRTVYTVNNGKLVRLD